MKRFRILVFRPDFFDEVTSNLICRWTNLLVVECPNVALNADAILHLPHLYPNMAVVEAGTGVPDLFFLSNPTVVLHSDLLEQITRLFSVGNLIIKFSGRLDSQSTHDYCPERVLPQLPHQLEAHSPHIPHNSDPGSF